MIRKIDSQITDYLPFKNSNPQKRVMENGTIFDCMPASVSGGFY